MKLKIKDIEWSFKVLSSKEYAKKWGLDSVAMTESTNCIVDFNEEHLTQRIVYHELSHVYFFSCCTDSTDMIHMDELNEIHAAIWEYHLPDVLEHGKLIYSHLLNQKDSLEEGRKSGKTRKPRTSRGSKKTS